MLPFNQAPPSPPPSDGGGSEFSSASEDSDPPYTPEELAAIFLDFYKFLATLHFDEKDLRLPPPGGWPGITRESCPGWKTDYAIEVLRRLPFYRSKAEVHYKTNVLDYTMLDPADFPKLDKLHEDAAIEFWDYDEVVDPMHLILFTCGYESGGRNLYLNVQSGIVNEEPVCCMGLEPVDVKTFFEKLKEDYRSLRLIPCLGRETIEADRVPERVASLGPITEHEVLAQDDDWISDLDTQYLRQLYRQHGWPDAFRRDDAKKAVDVLTGQRKVWPEYREFYMWRYKLE